MYKDEIVEEIHRIREEYARSLNYDLSAIVADLQSREFEGEWEEVDLSRKNDPKNWNDSLLKDDTLMNDRENLVRKESNRYRILKIFYDTLGERSNSTLNESDIVGHLVEKREMSDKEAESAINHLINEGLLQSAYFGAISITHEGFKEIEASIKYPDRSTKHFSNKAIHFYNIAVAGDYIMGDNINTDLRGTNISGNVAGQVRDNAQQNASNFSQNINQTVDEIAKLIDSLRDIAMNFPEEYEEQRKEALDHLEDLQEEIITPEKRKPSKIKANLMALGGTACIVAGHIAGATDFVNNFTDLANKAGFTLSDLNLPQLIQSSPK
ncbi:hypothetical protein V0288_19155 [Pannus brasiliensis CCIBt3594]|uniref:Uncharacterized protein n=1 Tax=Pannus brasiliensis CCIBt3594 TaxID=1427578 RepID=A0AAW9QY47_9CHRO